ncbi:MAG: acylphosphatase [Candidatus Binataceae bacterium]
MATRARIRLIVSGRVQGVGFRWAALDEAQRLGLAGWVRNRSGGGVEIVAEGDKDGLEKLALWARQGPRFASVSSVEQEWLEWSGELAGFEIR